jgi:CheY-like chemotaxis protein
MRPCFLVVDNEYPGSISTRKLLLESAKLNVITAYSADEALSTLNRFPNVDGVVIDTQMRGRPCVEIVQQIRRKHGGLPIVTVSPRGQEPCGGEQFHVSTFDPRQLLDALRQIRPNMAGEFEEHEDGAGPDAK